MIQTSFLLSLTDDPTVAKDSWYWLGISLSLSQAVGFHLDTPGYCKRNKRLSRRIWWNIFIQDRKLSLGMKYPCRIRDGDYEVPMLTLDDFEIQCGNPAVFDIVGQDMGLQDTNYQEKLAVFKIRSAALSVVTGDILRTQYTLSCPIQFDGKMPSTTMAPCRTATRSDIQSYERGLALCMEDAELQWNETKARQRLGLKDEALFLLYAETSLTHLTTLMALYRPLIWPVQKTLPINWELQAYSQKQGRLVASKVLGVCKAAQEKNLFSRLSHITATSVLQAAMIHLSFSKSADKAQQVLSHSKFDQLFLFLKDMDDVHVTARFGVSLLYSMLQKAGFLQESSYSTSASWQ